MDAIFFKKRLKQVGKTAGDIADRMGRNRSNISHIFNGNQRMTLDWAQAFADVLDLDLDVVLEKAGSLEPQRARQLAPGFAESDASPFEPKPANKAQADAILRALGGGPGIDAWKIKGNAMALNGLLDGDVVLVDSHKSELTRAGDIVLAQHYDGQTGSAKTLVRRHEPPVLVAAGLDRDDQKVLVVDGNNVVIRGKVIASWRATNY